MKSFRETQISFCFVWLSVAWLLAVFYVPAFCFVVCVRVCVVGWLVICLFLCFCASVCVCVVVCGCVCVYAGGRVCG